MEADLDAILADARRDTAARDAVDAELSHAEMFVVYVGAAGDGLWEWSTGLLKSANAAADLTPIGLFNTAVKAAWDATRDSSPERWRSAFMRHFSERNTEDLITLFGFDPRTLTREQLADAYETTSVP